MEEWKECKLGEITSLITKGTTPSMIGANFTTNGIKYIKSECILENSRLLDSSKYTFISTETNERLKRSQIIENDILFSMAGMFLGKTGIATKDDVPANTNQAVAIIRITPEKADFKYVYYFLNQKALITYINGISGQSAQPNINLQQISELNIKLPPLPTQQKIAAILSSLDDKIELNNKINTNLEQQAQALFKNWFVDDDTELIETEIGKMDILITDYVANGSFKDLADNVKYLSNETENVLIRLTDYNNNFSSDMVYISDESYSFLEKSKLFGDEIIISNVGTNVGTVFRCPRLNKKMSLAPNSIMIRGGIYEHYLYLYFTSTYGQGLLKSIVTGSAQPKFNKTNFRSLKIKIPREEKLKEFNLIYDSLYEKMINNQKENLHLASLRNTLLPKLMNREIEV